MEPVFVFEQLDAEIAHEVPEMVSIVEQVETVCVYE
jgi:hypothetical protein